MASLIQFAPIRMVTLELLKVPKGVIQNGRMRNVTLRKARFVVDLKAGVLTRAHASYSRIVMGMESQTLSAAMIVDTLERFKARLDAEAAGLMAFAVLIFFSKNTDQQKFFR